MGGGGNFHTYWYGMCHFLGCLFSGRNKFWGITFGEIIHGHKFWGIIFSKNINFWILLSKITFRVMIVMIV